MADVVLSEVSDPDNGNGNNGNGDNGNGND